ncbi:MAG: hypothetical protein QOD44_1224 [Solirubrobacteraceae bacterium]|nr:hypothetical protein [Solirubrobacteraceae bacterium]
MNGAPVSPLRLGGDERETPTARYTADPVPRRAASGVPVLPMTTQRRSVLRALPLSPDRLNAGGAPEAHRPERRRAA